VTGPEVDSVVLHSVRLQSECAGRMLFTEQATFVLSIVTAQNNGETSFDLIVYENRHA
jgi:hypothetical protein